MDNLKYEIDGVVITNYYDEYGDRMLKVENDSDETKKIEIHYYYSSVFFPYYRFHPNLLSKTWTIPEKSYMVNCSFIMVSIDGDDKNIISLLPNKNLKNVRDKIICVGLNKTGTTSLTRNLKECGFITWDDGKPHHSLNFSNLPFNNRSIGNVVDLIEKTEVDFFQDIPFSCPGISERIINFYPQCRYILTKRNNAEQWVKSVKKFWPYNFKDDEFIPNPLKGLEFFVDGESAYNQTQLLNLFESWDMDNYEGTLDEKLSQVYENHNLSVKNALINNNCDWIEIDVSKKGELKRLTDWLGIDNDKEDFVWMNKTNV